jgi:hypothetical protein
MDNYTIELRCNECGQVAGAIDRAVLEDLVWLVNAAKGYLLFPGSCRAGCPMEEGRNPGRSGVAGERSEGIFTISRIVPSRMPYGRRPQTW